ncbi:MAG TPA: TonB-dependent receptor [Novosphingobium sp.]|nr:TonB-dependent receptor [Novosphingobium sp.]
MNWKQRKWPQLLLGLAGVCLPAMAQAQVEAQRADPAKVQDIVVTAMRRTTILQKTPASIAVISGDVLSATGTADLAAAVENVPAVQVQKSNTGASFYIRGIGSRGVGGDSPISVNIDGLYQQQPDVVSGAFADVARIEVMRGPQGTLYGRNANGGTVNIITKDPKLGERSADISLGYGNYQTIHAGAALNLPVGETLAVRLVGSLDRHDGYLSNGLSDRNDRVLRGKLLWQPSDRLRVLLGVDYLSTASKGPSNVLLSDDNPDPRYAAPYGSFTDLPQGKPVYCSPNCQPYYHVESTTYRGQADYDLGFATLTGLVGVQNYRRDYLQSFSGGIEHDVQPFHQRSYEVRLASRNGSPVQWVVGGYWLDQDWSGEMKYVYHIDAADYYAINQAHSRAVFGQVTLPLLARLRAVAGLRYTADRFRKRLDTGDVDGTTGNLVSLTTGTDFRGNYSRLTYKAGLEYDLTDHAMVYGQFSTGFRSGGVDANGGAYGPETIKAIEGGLKSRFLDGRLQVNAGAYYYFYDGYQLDYIKSVGGALSDVITTSNVNGTTRVWGAELESVFRPTKADQIDLSVAWQGNRFARAILPTSCDGSGNCTYTDLTGRRLPRSPEWTINAALEHSFILANTGSIVAHVDGMYKSSYQADLISFTYSLQRAYATLNARLTYNLPHSQVSIGAYINNATNVTVIEQANTAGPTDRYGLLNDPRTYGLTLNGHF